jgi:CRP-like cAMP-binding protein
MERTDGGRPPKLTQEGVFDVFQTRKDRAEPLTAQEVADQAGCARRTALDRLDELDGDGLASKKVGGRARVWWIPIIDE